VTSSCLSPDGSRLAVADNDVVVVFPIAAGLTREDPAALLKQAEAAAGEHLRNFALESVR
jgi:hypothetical protein